jgi:asparagine synthase (glutamine-hydrolysing)
MCGIAGFVSTRDDASMASPLRRMADAIRHRGPDEEGFFERCGVGLGVRRLSIVDLEGSHQPISNEDGSVHAVFNGEIYNYVELRAALLAGGHQLKTSGDTETLVHLYEDYGADMLQHLRGMFAFAIWDERTRSLFVARDRLGKKPLYYSIVGDTFVFCSELGGLLEWPGIPRELNPEALLQYLLLGYVPNPATILKSVAKLPPAHFLTWKDGRTSIKRYWSLSYGSQLQCTYDEAVERVRDKLDESIRLRLRSDVPLGLLLSGGLDSNAILARLTKGLGENVRTFTVGFSEKRYDESDLARLSASHFGTDHHEHLAGTDLLGLLPDVVRHYGEPFADKSALPSLLISELVRGEVKVALNGDGGDEAFAGYPRYQLTALQQQSSRMLPLPLKIAWSAASMCGEGIGASKLSRNLRRQFLPETQSLISSEFFAGHHCAEIATDDLLAVAIAPLRDSARQFWSGSASPLNRMLAWDQTHYLPDDLLVKMDIASMAHSLEVRSPFLDHELVELCATLRPEWKVVGSTGKKLLRDIVAKDLPSELLRAPKRGFSVPLEEWFRTTARASLRDGVLPLHGALKPFLRVSRIEALIAEHQSRRANHAQRLWALWVLNSWARTFLTDS